MQSNLSFTDMLCFTDENPINGLILGHLSPFVWPNLPHIDNRDRNLQIRWFKTCLGLDTYCMVQIHLGEIVDFWPPPICLLSWS